MNLKVQILQSLRRLFTILVGLMMTWLSEKMLLFNICRRGLMPNLIKKSWTVSSHDVEMCDISSMVLVFTSRSSNLQNWGHFWKGWGPVSSSWLPLALQCNSTAVTCSFQLGGVSAFTGPCNVSQQNESRLFI